MRSRSASALHLAMRGAHHLGCAGVVTVCPLRSQDRSLLRKA
ncbi:hypothetical protein [Streptomyces sp. NRRL F-3218]|nr:hypothetical protein [Streptomyces sp. NRRL F-3218]